MLLSLLLILVTLPNIWSESLANNQTLENEFGIDLIKNYSGAEVVELLNIVVEEADFSIEKSYAEGYKQGILESSSNIARLTYLNDYYKEEFLRQRQNMGVPKWQVALWTIGGAVVGFGINSIYVAF